MVVSSVKLSHFGSLYNNGAQQVQKPKGTVCTSPIENFSPKQKLNSIISPQELKKYFSDICKYLNLDIIPRLNLLPEYIEGRCGGYNFIKNQINLSIDDLTCSDYKLMGVKGNIKTPLIDTNSYLPLIASKSILNEYLEKASRENNYGYDSLYMVPTTLEEKKRIILQKLAHELIHAQQHMILRQTEGIGEKMILKAWFHVTQKNKEESGNLNNLVEMLYDASFWGGKTPTVPKFSKNSPHWQLAWKWLFSIKNYPKKIATNEYYTNEIEKDAYKRSAEYVQMLFGPIKV